MRTAAVTGALLMLSVVAAGLAHGPPDSDRQLINEDIVRLVMTGTDQRVILQEIADRQVRFDLRRDVVNELRVAGVNDRIIEAMRIRQLDMKPADAPAPGMAAPSTPDHHDHRPAGSLQLTLTPPAGDEKTSLPFAIHRLPEGLESLPGVEVGRVTDLALAILCRTTDHVPDHWDIHSPIEAAPRHAVLLFRPGSTPDKIKKFDILRAVLDEIPLLRLAAGRHKLIVGLAGRSRGTGDWQLLASDLITVEIREAAATNLRLTASSTLRGNRMAGFAVEHVWKVVSDTPPAETGR